MDGHVLLWANVVGCIVGGLVGLVFAAVAWQNRDVAAALPYGALALAVSCWGFLYAALLLTSDPTAATRISVLTRVVTGFVPLLWFRFTTAYTGNDQLQSRRLMAMLWAITIAYAVLNLTAHVHGLVAYQVTFQTVEGLTAPVDPQDAVFWSFIAYAYTVIVAGFVLLFRFLLRSRNIYRKQTAAIVAGSMLPLVGNVVVLLDLVPHPALDVTPMLFGANGLIIGWALFQYDFLEVTPVATDRLVDDLPDPVLVLDDDHTIVEHNDAAERALLTESPAGTAIEATTLPPTETLAESDHVTFVDGDTEHVYVPQVSQIEDQFGQERGQLILFRDVTVQQRRLDRIEALQATSQQFLEATTTRGIATSALAFLDAELSTPVAAVYVRENDKLRVAGAIGVETTSVPDVLDADHPLRDPADGAGMTTIDADRAGFAGEHVPENVLVVPLGETGLLCLGVGEAGLAAEDEQFVHILRGTMTAALSRVERERELRESRRRVNQRTEQIEFFTGVLRHNIRNGVQVIEGQVDQLDDAVDESDRQHLDRVAEWANDLIELTAEIRLITDVVTAREDERRRPVDLAALLEERIATFERENDVDVSTTIPDAPPALANDLVGLVVDTILDNAVQHNDAEQPAIEVDVESDEQFVRTRIADNGPGIDDDLKEVVFEREMGTQHTAQGFGLYFVAVMMDLFGGDVWFEDREQPVTADGGDADGDDPDVDAAVDDHGVDRGTVAVLQFQRADAT